MSIPRYCVWSWHSRLDLMCVHVCLYACMLSQVQVFFVQWLQIVNLIAPIELGQCMNLGRTCFSLECGLSSNPSVNNY